MDIAHPTYLFYAESVICKLIGYVCDHPDVMGYQIISETKHYHTAGPNVQFIWGYFPSVTDTINGSLGANSVNFQTDHSRHSM
jgi:beta-galactosidase